MSMSRGAADAELGVIASPRACRILLFVERSRAARERHQTVVGHRDLNRRTHDSMRVVKVSTSVAKRTSGEPDMRLTTAGQLLDTPYSFAEQWGELQRVGLR